MRTAKTAVVLHEPFEATARPDELDALVQVEEVSAALQRMGWAVSTLPVDLDARRWSERLRAERPAFVFNLVESLAGSGRLIAVVPSLLEAFGFPFSGSGADALYQTSHKLLAKRWMALHGVPTPAWFEPAAGAAPDDGRWIVKSVWEHASLGIDDSSVVSGADALRACLDERRGRFGGEWFAERFLDGREFNISLIEEDGRPHVLPLAEIRFDGLAEGAERIVGYAAKWDTESPEYVNTPRFFPDLDAGLRQRLHDLALECWRLFGLRGYARVDVRLDRDGAPWVLEVNANPCLSSDAGFAAAAARGGRSFDAVIDAIVAAVVTDPAGSMTGAANPAE